MSKAIIIIKVSDKEIYQTLSKKRPQKNSRGGFGDYCCILGCKSAFYVTNRVKTGFVLFKLPKDPALRKKWLKDIGVLEGLINLVKREKSWVVNFVLIQSKFGYLWE